jgi:hypothetical protein
MTTKNATTGDHISHVENLNIDAILNLNLNEVGFESIIIGSRN